jgi:hypothetical protein
MRAPAGIELLPDGTWDCGAMGGEWSPGGCGCGVGGCGGEGGCGSAAGIGGAPRLADCDGEIWASQVRATTARAPSSRDPLQCGTCQATSSGWLDTTIDSNGVAATQSAALLWAIRRDEAGRPYDRGNAGGEGCATCAEDKCHPPARGSVDAQGQIGCNAARFATDIDKEAPRSIEYCGMICCDPETGSLSRTGPVRGRRNERGTNICDPEDAPCPPGMAPVGAYHSHTDRSRRGPASPADKAWTQAMAKRYPGFVFYVARQPHQCDRVNSDGSVSQEPY